MSPAAFFPDRSQRPVLDFVVQTFPFPLANTYDRLHQELDKQEPLAAAWQLRDAFECLLKFCACTAMADFLQAPHAEPDTAKLIELLCKPSGLSLGDWHTLLEMALKPLEPLAGAQKLELGARRLPDLFGVFPQEPGTDGVESARPSQRIRHDARLIGKHMRRDALDPARHLYRGPP